MKTLYLILLLMLQASRAQPQEVGVITGVIRTADGQAVAGMRVFARTSNETSRDKATIEAQAETDAEGRYRLEIRSGQYFIGTGSIDSPTWYPGVTDFAAAKPVRVSVNATIAIDINAQRIFTRNALQVQAISAMGLPLSKVTVTLTSLDRGPIATRQTAMRAATEHTDAAGIAVFNNLAAGRYALRFAYPGYIQNVPLVVDGASLPSPATLQLKMVPNAIISGFVKDTSGKPVRTEVWAGRIEDRDGRRQLVRMASEISDDEGHYVLVPPEPGSYFIAARQPGGLPLPGPGSTYYPGTRQLDEAVLLTVLDGETLGGIELVVPSSPK
jgi:5-hydroxyisourate hydrolase-like protein (transthyretin family)